jgi:uncharacterized protein (DUF1778 family)
MKKGRPKKSPSASKVESIEVRVTPSEKEGFRQAAELAGIGLSTWMRERLRRTAIRELTEAGQQVAFLQVADVKE